MNAGVYMYYFNAGTATACMDSYIGSTTQLIKRHTSHLSDLRRNKHTNSIFQRAFNKYGESEMEYDVIEEYSFPQDYPKEYIKEYIEARECYWQEENRCRYVILKGGEYYKGSDKGNKRLRKYTDSCKQPVYLVDKNLNILQKYEGVRDAERLLQISSTNISQAARLIRDSTLGLRFRYDYNLTAQFVPRPKSARVSKGRNKPELGKPILQYTLEGAFIKEYPSIGQTSRELSIQESGIKRCAVGDISHSGGYIFRLKSNPLPIKSVTPKKINVVICYRAGEEPIEYDNCNKASRAIGIHRAIIHQKCNSSTNQSYQDYTFKYKTNHNALS